MPASQSSRYRVVKFELDQCRQTGSCGQVVQEFVTGIPSITGDPSNKIREGLYNFLDSSTSHHS